MIGQKISRAFLNQSGVGSSCCMTFSRALFLNLGDAWLVKKSHAPFSTNEELDQVSCRDFYRTFRLLPVSFG